MVNINLLPPFKFLPLKWITCLLFYCIITMTLHMHYANCITEKKQNMALLQKEIDAINQTIQYKNQKTPLSFQKNPFSLSQFINLFKQLTHASHTGLYLTEISTIKGGLKLVGCAENMSIVSNWLIKLTNLNLKPTFKEMKSNEKIDDFPVKFSIWIKRSII